MENRQADPTLTDYKPTAQIIRNHILEIRGIKRLSRKELAEILGMSYFNVYNIETGLHDPTLETADKLMKNFKISRNRMFSPKRIMRL